MTHIAHAVVDNTVKSEPIATKKKLREILTSPVPRKKDVYFEARGLDGVYEQFGEGFASEMPIGTMVGCTNHPVRSWFAIVKRTGTDTFVVK